MSPSEPQHVFSDPMIEEVRAVRRAISEEFGNDVDRLCDHLHELERRHPEWIIVPEPSASILPPHDVGDAHPVTPGT